MLIVPWFAHYSNNAIVSIFPVGCHKSIIDEQDQQRIIKFIEVIDSIFVTLNQQDEEISQLIQDTKVVES